MQYSAEYLYIESSLEERKKSFLLLEGEINSFQPIPVEAFNEEKQNMILQYLKLNPGKSQNEIENIVSQQMDFKTSASTQFHEMFYDQFSIESINIMILSHAFCEALINTVLALGLYSKGKQDLFGAIDKINLKDKWTISPLTFIDGYQFDKSGSLYQTLNSLCKKRNALSHLKIEINDETGKNILSGNKGARFSIDKNSIHELKRFLTLPYDLVDNLIVQIEDGILSFQIHNLFWRRNILENKNAKTV